MSNEHPSTSTDSQTQPGPSLLTDRPLGGIFVHLLGLGTLFVLPAVVYLVANRDFTRQNARHALNWQLLYTGAFVVLFGTLGVGLVVDTWAPDETVFQWIGAAFVLAFAAGLFASTFAMLLNLAFVLIATGNAIFGTAWSYPLAPDFVGWLETTANGALTWRRLLVGYAATVPIPFASLFWTGLAGGPDGGLVFTVGFALVVYLLVASILAPAVLVRDARATAESAGTPRATWLPYVAGPLAIAALTYGLAAVQFGSESPPGDAIYAFAGAFWFATVVYLIRTP